MRAQVTQTHASNSTLHQTRKCQDQAPQHNDRIIILNKKWLDMILQGYKDIELRGQRAQPGPVWLGHAKHIHGKATITHCEKLCIKTFIQTQSRHGMQNNALPYAHTFALYLSDVQCIQPTLPFFHPRGAIGWVTYRNTHQAAAIAKPQRATQPKQLESVTDRTETTLTPPNKPLKPTPLSRTAPTTNASRGHSKPRDQQARSTTNSGRQNNERKRKRTHEKTQNPSRLINHHPNRHCSTLLHLMSQVLCPYILSLLDAWALLDYLHASTGTCIQQWKIHVYQNNDKLRQALELFQGGISLPGLGTQSQAVIIPQQILDRNTEQQQQQSRTLRNHNVEHKPSNNKIHALLHMHECETYHDLLAKVNPHLINDTRFRKLQQLLMHPHTHVSWIPACTEAEYHCRLTVKPTEIIIRFRYNDHSGIVHLI